MRVIEENLEVLPIRIFPSVKQKIDKVLEKDKEEIFENRSHFVRSAINHFFRSKRLKNILGEKDE